MYEGEWVAGYQSGRGSMRFRSGDTYTMMMMMMMMMRFRSGDTYTGGFMENVPHGPGQFLYPSGDMEEVMMEAGVRHGQSRYTCLEDGTVEESMFWEGQPRGPGKVLGRCSCDRRSSLLIF